MSAEDPGRPRARQTAKIHATLQLENQFGTVFQFTEIMGAGLRFGPCNTYETGIRIEHMPNADIKQPNNGLTAGLLRIARRL